MFKSMRALVISLVALMLSSCFSNTVLQQSSVPKGNKIFFGRIVYIDKNDVPKLRREGLNIPEKVPYFDQHFETVMLCFADDKQQKNCTQSLDTYYLGPDDYREDSGNKYLERDKIFSFSSPTQELKMTDIVVSRPSLSYDFILQPQPTIKVDTTKDDVVYLGDIVLTIVDLGQGTPAPITSVLNNLNRAGPVFAQASELANNTTITYKPLDLSHLKFKIGKKEIVHHYVPIITYRSRR